MKLATLAIAAAGVLMALAAGHHTVARADGPVIVGIDADPSGNSATALGTVEDCTQISSGDTLQIDLFVQGVVAIHGFDFSLGYDRSLFRVIGVDVDQMLAASPGSSVLDLSDSLPDSDGFFGARAQDLATVSSAAESGDGVLARVTLEAVGSGISGLIVAIEGVSPILTGLIEENGKLKTIAIEPNDQFGVFTGTVLEGAASVDEQCGSAPPPTDGQLPPASATSTPNETPTPATTASSTPTPSPGVLGGGALPSTGGGEIDAGTSGWASALLVIGGTLVVLAASSLVWHMRHRIVK